MPVEPQQPFNETIPFAWYAWGIEQLRGIGIDEETYRNTTVKDRLLNCMALPYTLSLVEQSPEKELRRLRLHRSTINRWLTNKTIPDANKFFGILLLCVRKNIQDVNLPDNKTAIWEAVSRTTGIIREKECKEHRCFPSRKQLRCVDLILDVTDPEGFFNDATYEVLERVTGILLHRSSEEEWTASFIRQAAIDWLKPYVLLRIGVISQWELF